MLNNKGNGNGKLGLPPQNIPLLKKTIKKQCYVCGNDMQVEPRFEKIAVLTCQQCEIQKGLFLLNLFKQARVQGLMAQEKAREQGNGQQGA